MKEDAPPPIPLLFPPSLQTASALARSAQHGPKVGHVSLAGAVYGLSPWTSGPWGYTVVVLDVKTEIAVETSYSGVCAHSEGAALLRLGLWDRVVRRGFLRHTGRADCLRRGIRARL